MAMPRGFLHARNNKIDLHHTVFAILTSCGELNFGAG